MPKTCSFLVPFFLTFDQDLADLVALCSIKSCLIPGTFQYPVCFTSQEPEAFIFPALKSDIEFMDKYLSVDANSRRSALLDRYGRPNLSSLRQKLEGELLSYQS